MSSEGTSPQTERVRVRRIGGYVDDRDFVGDVDRDCVGHDDVIVEEPLSIRLDDTLVNTTMRTPGNDIELAVGFCFTDGLLAGAPVTGAHEVISEDGANFTQIIAVDTGGLAPTPRPAWEPLSPAAGCAAGTTRRPQPAPAPVPPFRDHEPSMLAAIPAAVRPHQRLFDSTGAVHAAAAFDRDGEIGLVREDVGRHNAVDKLVGRLVLDDSLPCADFGLFVSGRVSIEIVQKAWAAGFGTVLAVSAPTSLAIHGARRAAMTLAGFVRNGRVNLYATA